CPLGIIPEHSLSRLGLGGGGAGVPKHSLSPQASVVVERVWPVPLGRAGAQPRLQPRRHRVLRLLRDGKHRPRGDMELLLTRAVQDVGARGDVVTVSKRLGRNRLLPRGLGLYPSPENIRNSPRNSLKPLELPQTPGITVEFLRRCRLEVGMKNNVRWELSPDIVARHFLKNVRGLRDFGVFLGFPGQIPGFGGFWGPQVNGLDTVRVPMDVVQFLRPKTKRFRHWREQQRQQLESSRERLL
uniref:Large ribosomal subunit protein bL9m n=1 Tax=Cyanoderma ruficeps TaxID=181631 RepID=A0A8C3P0X5_9PASS